MKIETRPYYCPTCGHGQSHATNHEDEIYCPCNKCGNRALYCVAAKPEYDAREFKTAVLRCYDFREQEYYEYTKLKGRLNGLGYKRFKVYAEHRQWEALKAHDGEVVKLYLPIQWADQFATNVGRLHKWWEAAWDNRLIHSGYWLDFGASAD